MKTCKSIARGFTGTKFPMDYLNDLKGKVTKVTKVAQYKDLFNLDVL
jgi:hypothetical protein